MCVSIVMRETTRGSLMFQMIRPKLECNFSVQFQHISSVKYFTNKCWQLHVIYSGALYCVLASSQPWIYQGLSAALTPADSLIKLSAIVWGKVISANPISTSRPCSRMCCCVEPGTATKLGINFKIYYVLPYYPFLKW